MYKRVALNGLAVLGLLAGASAYAEQAPGFYAGVGIGQATVQVDDVDFDDSDTAFKVFGGYNFNDNFAAEVTYFDGGAPSEDFDLGGGFSGSVEAEFTGLNFSAVGRIPVSESFAIFGKLGYASYDVKATARIEDISESASDSGNDLSYGVGAAFSFGQFDLRGEYEAVDVDGGAFNVLSVSGLFRF
jgi:Outer membrane protein beta-barrel domain